MILTDVDAWEAFPHHRKWFNKLELALSLGLNCGPSGTTSNHQMKVIVRPIYNLAGMGVGVTVIDNFNTDCVSSVPPGHFWCEFVEGVQLSVTFIWNECRWVPISAWQALKRGTKIVEWLRSACPEVSLPDIFNDLSDVRLINVEMIVGSSGITIIEAHLRDTPDPDYDHLVVIHSSNMFKTDWIQSYIDRGYVFISSVDDAHGHLEDFRVGFLVKDLPMGLQQP